MRAGSLCSGIRGLDLAVEAHFDADPAWYSEIEPAPCAVLERELPGVPNLGDLTAVDWSNVEPVDVLSAGYPCQPFSHAGRRRGTEDDRHLWPHIADAVRVLRPRWVVLENVAGHLSLGFDVVLADLAEAGFDAEWCVLRASDVGAPHRRERLFVVARDATSAREDAHASAGASRQATGERGRRAPADTRSAGTGWDAGAVPRQAQEGTTVVAADVRAARDGRAAPPDATRIAEREPSDETHTVAGGGQARALARRGGGAPTPDSDGERLSRRTELDCGPEAWRFTQRAARHDTHRLGEAPVAWGAYGPAIRRWERVLGRPAPRPTDDRGRLNPPFVEWMLGYPEGWTAGVTRTAALKALGNSVVPQQAAAALVELAPIAEGVAA